MTHRRRSVLLRHRRVVANLDEAVGKVLAMQATFTEFARTVLATTYNAQEEAKLRAEVDLRYAHYHAITDKGLPKNKPLGAGHLDAVGMILNGVAGLDRASPDAYDP